MKREGIADRFLESDIETGAREVLHRGQQKRTERDFRCSCRRGQAAAEVSEALYGITL